MLFLWQFFKKIVRLSILLLASMSWHTELQASNVYLTWQDTANDKDGFKIERMVAGLVNATLTVSADVTSYVDSALAAGTVYCYQVRAFNSAGDSDPSNQSCATAADATISVSPTSITPKGMITATWSGGVGDTSDWIGLYVSGAADANYIDWIYTTCSQTPGSGRSSGSCSYVLPATLSAGTYNLRLFTNSLTKLATSNTFTVTTSSPVASTTQIPSLSVTPTSVAAKSAITATWSGIAIPDTSDWIGLYTPGAADANYIDWIYTTCSQTPGSGRSSGSCSYVLPATLSAGTYNLRLFTNSLTKLATSNTFTVTTSSPVASTTQIPSLSVTPTSVAAKSAITATWSGIAIPDTSDWIGLYTPGAADANYIDWIYTTCSQTPGSGRSSGSCSYVLPATVSAGTYSLRLFTNSLTKLATSNTFTVTTTISSPVASTTQIPSLSVTPTSVAAKSAITATWSGIAIPDTSDWIGLYTPGAADANYIDWIYTTCSQTPGSGRSSGSCSYVLPATVSAGTYSLRLFTNSLTKLATSNTFTVTTPINAAVQTVSASLRLTWTDNSNNEDGFKIERLVAGLVDVTLTVPANATSYTDSALAAGTVYCYRVLAFNSAGDSDPSNQSCATAQDPSVGSASSAPTLTVSPTTVRSGATVTAMWAGITAPTPKDWIGLYSSGTADAKFLNRIYVSCSATAGSARASGSCFYLLPATLSGGNYELRLFSNDSFTRLATSNAVTVSNSSSTPIVLANSVGTGNGSSTSLLPQVSREWSDYDLRVNLRSMNSNSIGVMFRYQDDRNYYRFVWNEKSKFRRVEKIENGTVTVLANDTVGYVKGRTYQAQIIAQGTTLRVFIDGAQIFSVADSTFAEGTVGLYSFANQSSFDNVVVQDLNTGAVLLSQDFDDGTFTGWTVVDQGRTHGPSTWSATTGSLLQSSNIDGTFALYTARNWRDYRFTVKLQSIDSDSIGVMFRYQDNNNYYRFSWNNQSRFRRLEKVQNGLITILAQDAIPYSIGNKYNLEITALDMALKVRVDGNPVFSVTDASFDKGTIALYSYLNDGSRFDDVLIQDLATSAVLFSADFTDGGLAGWTMIDETLNNGPSAWSVQSGALVQSSNIGSTNGFKGTFALH